MEAAGHSLYNKTGLINITGNVTCSIKVGRVRLFVARLKKLGRLRKCAAVDTCLCNAHSNEGFTNTW